MNLARGQVYLLDPPPQRDPKQRRAVVVMSRQTLCNSPFPRVVVAPIHSDADGLSTEVLVGVAEGLKRRSAVKCDQLFLIEKSRLTNFIGALGTPKLGALRDALRIALAVE